MEKNTTVKYLGKIITAYFLGISCTYGVMQYNQSENYIKKENAIEYMKGLGKIVYDESSYISKDKDKIKEYMNFKNYDVVKKDKLIEYKQKIDSLLDNSIQLKKRILQQESKIKNLTKLNLSTQEKSYTFKDAEIEFNDKIYFEINSYNLEEHSLLRIKKIAKKIKEYNNIQIILNSYENKFEESDRLLKFNRLNLTRKEFISNGLPTHRISILESSWLNRDTNKKYSKTNKLLGMGISIDFQKYKN